MTAFTTWQYRNHSVPLGKIVQIELPIAHPETIHRQNLWKKCPADLVAPLDENVGKVLLRCRIADLAGLYDRANLVIGERHHLLGGPKLVGGQTECNVKVGDTVNVNGNHQGAKSAYNTRFGLYPNGANAYAAGSAPLLRAPQAHG